MASGYGASYGSSYGIGSPPYGAGGAAPTPADGRGPFRARYGSEQGRVQLPANFTLTDGNFAYVLGSNLKKEVFDFNIGDYVEIYQDLDLTSAASIRLNLGFFQPPDMPTTRDISTGATLKRSQVGTIAAATVESQNVEPYAILTGETLFVDVDGGGAQTVTFSTNLQTAEDIAAEINAQLSPGVGTTNLFGQRVRIKSETPGTSSTIEVTGGTAAAKLNFPAGVKTGGDDLSAIVAPNANFTTADVGLPLTLSGTSGGSSDKTTVIDAIITERLEFNGTVTDLGQTTALLRDQITTEATGFTATINGALWQSEIYLDAFLQATFKYPRGTARETTDHMINVSKATGTHRLTFRLVLTIDP